ncbi:MAG: hypothetical protein M3461_15570 [Pseudomonadota bacterium]|nr:hypothetical protein [Pseudomonadota bacterium]
MSQPGGAGLHGDHLERLLEQGPHDYVNHPRGAVWQDGELRASRLVSGRNFDGTEAGVVGHLTALCSAGAGRAPARLCGADRLFYYDYGWSLNEP